MSKDFRLIQISDTHVLGEQGALFNGVDTWQRLHQVLEDALAQQPDGLVLTGDLGEDLQVATYQMLRAVLAEIPVPIYVLNGNHDHPGHMEAQLCGDHISYLTEAVAGEWQLIGVDTRIEGADHGRITVSGFATLDAALARTSDRNVVIALHHPAIAHCTHPICQLENASELLTMLEPYTNVKLLLNGHVHHAAHARHAGFDLLSAPAVAVQSEHLNPTEPPQGDLGYMNHHRLDHTRYGYRIIDLPGNGGDYRTEVRWLT